MNNILKDVDDIEDWQSRFLKICYKSLHSITVLSVTTHQVNPKKTLILSKKVLICYLQELCANTKVFALNTWFNLQDSVLNPKLNIYSL